ncbi:NUDIX domain-containing protein [Ditylenchus destructor]|nr:NUDIX domain-containing protein [Ditylenchus destructor]
MRIILVTFVLLSCCAILTESAGSCAAWINQLATNAVDALKGRTPSLTPPAKDGLDDTNLPFYTQPIIGDINVCASTGTEEFVPPIKREKHEKMSPESYLTNRPIFTFPHVKKAPWADPDHEANKAEYKKIKFNVIDTSTGKSVDRRSYYASYYKIEMQWEVIGVGNDQIRLPLFPMYPTVRLGLGGRGKLGRYYVNHTGDAILSHKKEGEKLKFVAIQRSSNDKWGMPGGFVDPRPTTEKRETPKAAAKRELKEEALLGIKPKTRDEDIMETFKKKQEMEGPEGDHYRELAKLLKDIDDSEEICERKIYQGIVVDGRFVENAHIETTVYNWHILDDKLAARIKPVKGDDAKEARWMSLDELVTEIQMAADPKIKAEVDKEHPTKFVVWNTHLPIICQFAKMHREKAAICN